MAQPESAWRQWHSDDEPITIGVSACLLGEQVRYDGGHKHDRFLTDTLGKWVTWKPVCPEVEVGMPVPRPTIRLRQDGDETRLIDPVSGVDHTAAMASYAKKRVRRLLSDGLDGFVFKRGSPSCGMERVKVWGGTAPAHKRGVGHFAKPLMETAPGLPTEEEGRLNDPLLRENFIERIFCQNRWRIMKKKRVSRRKLVAFHTAHKMLLRAHDEKGYRALGRLVGDLGTRPDREIVSQYESLFAETLARKPTARKHVNVMHHLMGYLKNELGAAQKRALLTIIEDFRQGLVPLSGPLSLLRYEIRNVEVEYALEQLYLDPHPKELMLRNHV